MVRMGGVAGAERGDLRALVPKGAHGHDGRYQHETMMQSSSQCTLSRQQTFMVQLQLCSILLRHNNNNVDHQQDCFIY